MDISYFFIKGWGLLAEKGNPKFFILELDLDDFKLKSTIKHLAVNVINYQMNSLRNMGGLSVAWSV